MNVILDNNLPVTLGREWVGLPQVESATHVKRMELRDADELALFASPPAGYTLLRRPT